MRTLYRSIWIPSAVAILAMVCFFGTQPLSLPIPGPMASYSTGDRSLKLNHPGNWKPRERGAHGIRTEVEFEPARNARMVVTIDLEGSLFADILKSQDAQTNRIAEMIPGGTAIAERQPSPLERMHAMQGTMMEKRTSEYPDFKDGALEKTRIAGKEALVTTFTWSLPGLFGSRPMVGRRVTLFSGEHQVTAVYGCLKEMQAVVLPVFDQMANSLEVDTQGDAK